MWGEQLRHKGMWPAEIRTLKNWAVVVRHNTTAPESFWSQGRGGCLECRPWLTTTPKYGQRGCQHKLSCEGKIAVSLLTMCEGLILHAFILKLVPCMSKTSLRYWEYKRHYLFCIAGLLWGNLPDNEDLDSFHMQSTDWLWEDILWSHFITFTSIKKRTVRIINTLIFASPLSEFPFSWTPTVSTAASPWSVFLFLLFLRLLSLVKNRLLHAQRTVATQKILQAEPIPPGFHLRAGETSTLKVHLENVLNGRIWKPRGDGYNVEDILKAL